MKKILIPTLLLLITMSSCNLYKHYERPEIDFVDSLYNRIPTANNYESIASLTWKELFTDTILQNLIEIGLNNNTNLEIARLKDMVNELDKTAFVSIIEVSEILGTGKMYRKNK